jgi:predicted DNA-binding transcriptional regulator AlpA
MARRIVYAEDLKSRWGIKANASTIWRWEKIGKFPRHFMHSNQRAWFDDVIDGYVESLDVAHDSADAPVVAA